MLHATGLTRPWPPAPALRHMGLLVKGTPSGQPSGLKPSASQSLRPKRPSTGLQHR